MYHVSRSLCVQNPPETVNEYAAYQFVEISVVKSKRWEKAVKDTDVRNP